VAALALLGIARPAWAGDPEPPPLDEPATIVVETGTDSVTVEADAYGTIPGSGGAGGGSACWLDPIGTIGQIFYDSFQQQLEAGLDPFLLWCDGEMRGLVWLDPNSGGAVPAVDPETIAMHIRDEMPVPQVEIGANPARGMVGIEAWFWISGYDGSALTQSTPAFGQTVEVRATPTSYRWDFGDGTVITTTSLGVPYPEESDITHAYERSSAGLPQGYPVEVTFTFEVAYRVDGGPWQPLPGISRTATLAYPVQESQAVIER